MKSNLHSQQLVHHLGKEHCQLVSEQKQLRQQAVYPDVQHSSFLVNSLVNIILCEEMDRQYAQQREICHIKVRNMRIELNRITRRLAQFQQALQTGK